MPSAGANSDWCYKRQKGSSNAYKLAFCFHDDADANFCIRCVQSTNNPDTITEVFTVDNGNVSCTSTVIVGNTKASFNSSARSLSLNKTTIVAWTSKYSQWKPLCYH